MPMQPREFLRQANLAEREPAEANPAQRRAWPVPSGGLIRDTGTGASAGGPSKPRLKKPLPVQGVLMREGLPGRMRRRERSKPSAGRTRDGDRGSARSEGRRVG